MLKKNNRMISMDYMDDEPFAFGLDTGSYQSLFEDGTSSNDFSGKIISDGVSSQGGFFSDLTFSEDGRFFNIHQDNVI